MVRSRNNPILGVPGLAAYRGEIVRVWEDDKWRHYRVGWHVREYVTGQSYDVEPQDGGRRRSISARDFEAGLRVESTRDN